MQRLLVLTIAIVLQALLTVAQAAQPSKGVGSVISFTTKKGEEIKDAKVKVVTVDSIIWTAVRPDGRPFGGRTPMAELPEQLASEFGYDPKKAAEIQAANAQAIATQNQLNAERRVLNARTRQAMETKMTIIGKVSQVLEDGLMIIAEAQAPKISTTLVSPTGRFPTPFTIERTSPPTDDGSPLFVGRCLVTDASKNGWTDGQAIWATVYPNGTYTYTSVGAGTATIQKFVLEPSAVTNPATPGQFNALKRAYPFNTPIERRY